MEHKNTLSLYETVHLNKKEAVNIYTSYSCGNYVMNHWHDAVEIIYLFQGDLSVTIEEKKHIMEEDTFLLINTKILHSTFCRKENYAMVLQLPEEYLQQIVPDMEHLVFQVPYETTNISEQQKLTSITEILREMYLLQEHKPAGSNLRLNSLLYELLYQLYINFRKELPHMDYLNHTKNLSILKKVMSYTEDHYVEALSIDEIAKIAGLQPNYFCRFFKQNVGCSYLNYLNELRISHIYKDLIQTDMPVYQILEKHGFTNYKLFRRMFTERFSNTPMNIRKKISNPFNKAKLN